MKIHFPSNKLVLTLVLYLVTGPVLQIFSATTGFSITVGDVRLAAAEEGREIYCTCQEDQPKDSQTYQTEMTSVDQYTGDDDWNQQTMVDKNATLGKSNDFPWILFMPVILSNGQDQCTDWQEYSGKWIYYFDNIIRVGDDIDFNEHHPGQNFCITTAESPTYTATFTIPDDCDFTAANLQYWATGVYGDNRIYINDKLVDTTCHTGNIATQGDVIIAGRDTCCTNGAIDITDAVHTGTNTLRIETVLFPGDATTPHDDIELYGLHITLE